MGHTFQGQSMYTYTLLTTLNVLTICQCQIIMCKYILTLSKFQDEKRFG